MPMTCLFYKWKFIPFDPLRMLLTPYPPPLTTSNLSSVSMNFELFFISHVYAFANNGVTPTALVGCPSVAVVVECSL